MLLPAHPHQNRDQRTLLHPLWQRTPGFFRQLAGPLARSNAHTAMIATAHQLTLRNGPPYGHAQVYGVWTVCSYCVDARFRWVSGGRKGLLRLVNRYRAIATIMPIGDLKLTESDPSQNLATRWQELESVKSEIEDGLLEAGSIDDWSSIGTDYYDNSIEIYGVHPDVRLSQSAVDWLIKGCGFSKIYVNHTDGWQTHYGSSEVGWRRRYVSDPTATTTNVIAGPENNGYYETNRFPDGFPKEWLESGYFRVVPDPLMPVAADAAE